MRNNKSSLSGLIAIRTSYSTTTYLSILLREVFYFSAALLPRLLISHLTQLLGNSCVDGAVLRHSIELALDISLAPHAYKGPCLLGRPARRHSRMRVQLMQLMASARHATCVQSHDLEANPL